MGNQIPYQFLFEKMAGDLATLVERGQVVITPTPNLPLVACPVCLRLFTLDDLNKKILTPEHVPPEKMGGKVETLTCKSCNHSQGAKLEGPLMNRIRYREFGNLEVNTAAESRLILDGHAINTFVTNMGEATFRIDFDPTKSQNEHEQIFRSLIVGKRIGELKIVPKKKFKERESSLGLLRIAYLKAYIAFGYGYILHRNMEIVRKQLIETEIDLLPYFGVIDKNVPQAFPSIGIVTHPKSWRSFFICLELKSKLGTQFRYSVLLPLVTLKGPKIYDQLAKASLTKNWPQLTVVPL